MSELMINQIQVLLTKLSEDVQRMGELSTEEISNLVGMLDTLAAHVLGTKAVVAAIAKKYPVDMADVEAWLIGNVDQEGASYEAIKATAKHLITGEKPAAPGA